MSTSAKMDDHLQLALTAAAMHTWSWDIRTGHVEWSGGVATLVGMTPEEFGGTFEAYQRVLHPDDRPAVLAAIEKAVADASATYEIEHRLYLPGGEIRWLACRGQVMRSETGEPLSMVGVVWDTTARKTAEARILSAETALRLSEERKNMLVEQATDGIFLADETSRFLEVNSAGQRMLGYSKSELLSMRVADVFDPEELAARPLGLDVSKPGSVVVAERRMRRKDGSLFDVEVSAKALPGGFQQAFIRDIGDRKDLQARLLRADRLASLGRLAAGVAHEINNPLAYTALNHELAEAKLALLPEEPAVLVIRHALGVAREGTDRVRRIVRGLATFGRGDDDVLASIDVHHALDSAYAIAENEIRHRAQFTQSYSARGLVRANEARLGQVFVNLLVNAADAIEQGSVEENEILVETRDAPDGRVVISVSDTGSGIHPDAKDRIFDPFFTTKPAGVGTGLGLWICHNIVSALGGEIVVENNRDRGATVRVLLNQAGEVATETREAPPPVARGPVRRARILVVDDEPAIGNGIAKLLPAHEVTIAKGGREAGDLCATRTFDCIVCDLMMPDLCGEQLYEILEKDGRGIERRMVFMTGGTFVPRARAFLSRVPNKCLQKPFGRRELEAAVDVVLHAAAERRG